MAAMADGTVCRRHTFCTARNGVQTNTADGNSDKPFVEL